MRGICVALVLGALAMWAGCGGVEKPVEPDEHAAHLAAYEEMLAAIDSLAATTTPIDTLFLDYDLAALRPAPLDSGAAARWVDSTLATLTRDEKIGQLFIVHLPEPSMRRYLKDDAREAVERYGVGGFLVPRLLRPRDVFRETQRLQVVARVPLFFAADYERGVGRYDNAFTELPSNMGLGATRDTLLAAAAGRLTAIESRAIGVNLLFAPVVDVNSNPANPIINIRSYGERSRLVGEMAGAFVREAQRYGVLTTLKHFPGHGNTSVDSHTEMGAVPGTRTILDTLELRPYRMVLDREAPAGVMSAHLWIRALDPGPVPATFSRNALTVLLREQLGFDGLVVTDDIRMGALQGRYRSEERILRPLLAGADVILTPSSLPDAVQVVRRALEAGTYTEEALDRSVRRVLWAKARAGLHVDRYASSARLRYLMREPRGAYLAQTIADHAVTLLKTSPALPVRAEDRVALVQIRNYEQSESIDAAMEYFAEALGGASFAADVRFDRGVTRMQIDEVMAQVAEADVVVLALYLRLQSGRGDAGLQPSQEPLVRRLLASGKPVVLVTFGNPYAVTTFSEADAFLVAYDQSVESVHTAARILRGEQRPRGRLPITVDPFPYGAGLDSLTHPAAR